MTRVVLPEAMYRLRELQAMDAAIESVERDLDRAGWSFEEAMSLHAHLKKLRAMRSSLAEEFDEGENEEVQTAVD